MGLALWWGEVGRKPSPRTGCGGTRQRQGQSLPPQDRLWRHQAAPRARSAGMGPFAPAAGLAWPHLATQAWHHMLYVLGLCSLLLVLELFGVVWGMVAWGGVEWGRVGLGEAGCEVKWCGAKWGGVPEIKYKILRDCANLNSRLSNYFAADSTFFFFNSAASTTSK